MRAAATPTHATAHRAGQEKRKSEKRSEKQRKSRVSHCVNFNFDDFDEFIKPRASQGREREKSRGGGRERETGREEMPGESRPVMSQVN